MSRENNSSISLLLSHFILIFLCIPFHTDDEFEEGVDYLNFAPQPSNLGLIQGPVRISGGDSPYVEPLGNPVMLPNETNPAEFLVPPNITIDTAMYLVNESKQVDTVILNNLDVRGNLPSIGTLMTDQFEGYNMANGIFVLDNGPFSGIYYEDIEVFTFNLGNGVDVLVSELHWSILAEFLILNT